MLASVTFIIYLCLLEIKVRRWRHLIVAVGMVPALVMYIGLMMQIADFVTDIHIILDFLFYAVAGLAWIPLAGKVVGWLAEHESR